MSTPVAAPGPLAPKKLESDEKPLKIRITMTSLNIKALEKVCADFKRGAQEKNVKVKGPVRHPTKILKLTVRKSPCGNGTNSFDRYQMRIHKRVLDLTSPQEIVKAITSAPIEQGVDVEVFFL
jgi:small subunit ribosomal protein S20e